MVFINVNFEWIFLFVFFNTIFHQAFEWKFLVCFLTIFNFLLKNYLLNWIQSLINTNSRIILYLFIFFCFWIFCTSLHLFSVTIQFWFRFFLFSLYFLLRSFWTLIDSSVWKPISIFNFFKRIWPTSLSLNILIIAKLYLPKYEFDCPKWRLFEANDTTTL